MCVVILFFFFKQKTAYEMRISDWSSDVCSSDLPAGGRGAVVNGMPLAAHAESGSSPRISRMPSPGASLIEISDSLNVTPPSTGSKAHRSEERRVGKECVSTRRSRWSQYH